MEKNSVFTLHEIAKTFDVSYQNISKRYNQFKINQESTGNQLEEIKKDHRKALCGSTLKAFIEFLEYDYNQLLINRESTVNQPLINQESTDSKLIDRLLQEKDRQIDYLKKEKEKQETFFKEQLDNSHAEKNKLLDLHERQLLRKDVLLGETLRQLNAQENNLIKYKRIAQKFIDSSEQGKEAMMELLDPDKKRIALIEDDEDFSTVMQMNLEKAGYDVLTFSSAPASNDYYTKKVFHLTILDLNLGTYLGGEKYFEMLQEFDKGTPVIIVSGEEEARIELAALKIKAAAWFKKPASIEDIIDKVESIIGS